MQNTNRNSAASVMTQGWFKESGRESSVYSDLMLHIEYSSFNKVSHVVKKSFNFTL